MAISKYDPLSLKEVEETQEKGHPWARNIKDVYSHRIKHAHNSISNPIYPNKEGKQPEPDRVQFTVLGDRVTKEFIYCCNLVKGLYKYRWKNFYVPVIRGCNTIEWPETLHKLKLRFKNTPYCLQSSVVVLLNNMIIGGEKELQKLVETKLFYYLCLDYYNEGVEEFARFVRSTNRPFAYMHVSIDDKHIGTLIYMLYADIVPHTCENFLRLCKETKGGYGGTPVHRIVKDGWIQCGGFGLKSASLNCENFIIPFDRRGVLAMANDGRDEDCSTQFFVVLQPAPWMNHKYVAFGQLIEGAATLEKIESVTTWYESPTSQINLYRCGILNMVCHDIRINKEADQYIDGHIEDLNSLVEVLWEHLLEKTFFQARILERMRASGEEGTEASSQYGLPTNMLERTADENHEFDEEEIEFKVEEEDDTYKSPKSVRQVKTHRPYYIPLTDVPYPGDVKSDFDLKKFLKGDYCLESDLSHMKDKVSEFPLGLWQDSPTSSFSSEEESLGSEEQLELDRYINKNLNKVSFAGVVIKNIKEERKSAVDFERYYFKYYSSEPIITDEKLRKIKLAAAEFELRQKLNNKSESIFTEEKLQKMKLAAAQHEKRLKSIKQRSGGSYGDDDSNKVDDDDVIPTSFDEAYKDDDNEEKSKAAKFRIATQNGPEETAPPKSFMKRRLTAFVRPQDIPVDIDDDDDDDEEEPALQPSFTLKTNVNKSHFATQESPKETAHSKSLMHDVEKPTTKPFTLQKSICDKNSAIKPSTTAQIEGAEFADEDDKGSTYTIKRRATAFVRAADIRKLDDISEHKVSVLTGLYDNVYNDEPGPTLKNYKPIAELEHTKLLLTHSSHVLQATSKESRLESRLKHLRHPRTLEESSGQFANIQHATKLDNKLSSDYVKTIDEFENRFSHSIRSMEYAKKRPTISVSQYQLMNRQYQEALDRKATPI